MKEQITHPRIIPLAKEYHDITISLYTIITFRDKRIYETVNEVNRTPVWTAMDTLIAQLKTRNEITSEFVSYSKHENSTINPSPTNYVFDLIY